MSGLTLSMIAALEAPDLKKVLEADFQAAVVAYAQGCGWLV